MKYPNCVFSVYKCESRGLILWRVTRKRWIASIYAFSFPEAALFWQHQESRPLAGPDFLSTRREFVSYSQPIRFDRLDSEHAQNDEKSMNHGLPVLDQARGRYSWCWSRDARPLDEKGIYAKRVSHNYQVHLPVEFKFWDLFFVPFSTCWAFNLLLFRCRKDFHATVRVNVAWLSAGGNVMHKNSHPVWSFSRGCTAFFDITPLSELRKKRHP